MSTIQYILHCLVIYDEGHSELNSLQEKMRAFADIFVSKKVTKQSHRYRPSEILNAKFEVCLY